MTANQTLLAFTCGAWFLFYAFIKVGIMLQGKRFTDGPSMFPVIPIIPVGLIACGAAVNAFLPPWGTILVVAAHLAYVVWTVVRDIRHSRESDSG